MLTRPGLQYRDLVRHHGHRLLVIDFGGLRPFGHPFHDATSGMYAANRHAMPTLGIRYTSRAPEVESLLRLREQGLRVVEVPVHMRERASGESKLRGSKAVKLVLTVVSTLLLYGVWRRLRRSR